MLLRRDPNYKRLPGGGVGLLRTTSYWLGPAHLMAVYVEGYTERYRRFDYRDIEAIVIRKTRTATVWNYGLGIAIVLFTAWAFSFDLIGRGMLLIGVAALIPALVLNALRGPTCVCYLRTAVQNEKLPGLTRLRKARRALAQLRPLIEAAQGGLTGDMIVAAQAATAPTGPATMVVARPAVAAVSISQSKTATAHRYDGRFHAATFGLLLGIGALMGASIFVQHAAIVVGESVLALGAGACAVVSMVRQHGNRMRVALQALTWASLAYAVVYFFFRYIYGMVVAFRNPRVFMSQWEIYRQMASISPLDSEFLLIATAVFMLWAFVLAGFGLLLLRDYRRETASAAAPVVAPA